MSIYTKICILPEKNRIFSLASSAEFLPRLVSHLSRPALSHLSINVILNKTGAHGAHRAEARECGMELCVPSGRGLVHILRSHH